MSGLTDEALAEIEKRHQHHADCFSDVHHEDYSAYDWAHHDRAALLAEVKRQTAEIRMLREALAGMCLGSEALETALWGHLADDQTGTVTFKLGALRKARAALSAKDKA